MNFSEITETLYIGTTPGPEDYPALVELGIRLIINMRIERPPFTDPYKTPLKFLWLPTLDSPLFPIPIRLLQQGVNSALAAITNGKKVLAHCAGGVHRGVAMGACILIAQGYTPSRAMQLIKEKREHADPEAWYIRRRIEHFAETWRQFKFEGF